MNDIRRTILWVVFGFSLVLLWDQWQIHNGQKATFFPQPVTAKAPADAAAPAASRAHRHGTCFDIGCRFWRGASARHPGGTNSRAA